MDIECTWYPTIIQIVSRGDDYAVTAHRLIDYNRQFVMVNLVSIFSW